MEEIIGKSTPGLPVYMNKHIPVHMCTYMDMHIHVHQIGWEREVAIIIQEAYIHPPAHSCLNGLPEKDKRMKMLARYGEK